MLMKLQTQVLFAFEQDFVDSLRCIPMAVRFKLDLCGIKVSLRQWSRFTLADRSDMLTAPCDTPANVERYRLHLIDRIAQRAGELASPIPVERNPEWAVRDRVPSLVQAHALSIGLKAPTKSQWRALTDLQRFALLKLSREGHDNVNFAPALREFGLWSVVVHQGRGAGMIEAKFP